MKIEKSKGKKILGILALILIVAISILVILFVKGNNIEKSNDTDKIESVENDIADENQEIEDEGIAEEQIKAFEIETKYCTLFFPEIWKNHIEVKFSEEAGYKAEFYGLVEGKDAQHLFDVCFNSDDGNLLGYFENEDEIINVSFDVFELEFDDSWSQEEIDQIYSMQEEMNFVMEMLGENDNYVTP